MYSVVVLYTIVSFKPYNKDPVVNFIIKIIISINLLFHYRELCDINITCFDHKVGPVLLQGQDYHTYQFNSE